jgi:hypothetical protein
MLTSAFDDMPRGAARPDRRQEPGFQRFGDEALAGRRDHRLLLRAERLHAHIV